MDMIKRARRVMDGRTVESHVEFSCRDYAEALLAEHDARVAAERERDAWRRVFGDDAYAIVQNAEARVATLKAALQEIVDACDEHGGYLLEYAADDLATARRLLAGGSDES